MRQIGSSCFLEISSSSSSPFFSFSKSALSGAPGKTWVCSICNNHVFLLTDRLPVLWHHTDLVTVAVVAAVWQPRRWNAPKRKKVGLRRDGLNCLVPDICRKTSRMTFQTMTSQIWPSMERQICSWWNASYYTIPGTIVSFGTIMPPRKKKKKNKKKPPQSFSVCHESRPRGNV